jgi:hypothetical protein
LIDKEEIKKIEKKVRSTLTNRTLSPCWGERSKYTFGRPITTRVINWSINGHYIYAMGVSTLNSHREVTRYLTLYSAQHI